MAIQGKDLRGSGSKENVGRKPIKYKTKILYKRIPESIYDLCASLVDAEKQKFILKNRKL